MQNKINQGTTLDWTNGGAAVVSGQAVVVGSIVGIALGNIAGGASGVLDVGPGVFELPKAAPLAITQGDKVYYAAGANNVNKTNTDVFIGYAAESALSAATTVRVLRAPIGS
jgi:predicted RecA/RadA family phage recombinase